MAQKKKIINEINKWAPAERDEVRKYFDTTFAELYVSS